MYSLVYYNNYKNNKIKIDQLVIKNSTDLICTLCFEEIMTNEKYNYDMDIYTHTCNCRPNIHIICFKQCIKKRGGCIICNAKIYSKNEYYDTCNYCLMFITKYLILLCFSCIILIFINELSHNQ